MVFRPTTFTARFLIASLTLIALFSALAAQARTYPDKIRGYKVERTVVEVKKPRTDNSSNNKGQSTAGQNDGATADDSDVDQLIQFGQPELARASPLGITFAVPIVVAPVTQKGHVDFLVFEDMVINGRSVEISDYNRSFDLPNKDSLTLKDPLRIYIYLPNALLAAIGEWTDSKDAWPVTGRVYVFGKFKKSVWGISTSFKRCVPVELNLTMRNPLRER
jgi:hypothetical protein